MPDPIDFRAYSTVNIYEDKNAHFREGPFLKVPLPEKRKTNGILDATMEQESRHELVLGTHGRSGEQWTSGKPCLVPWRGRYPKPIFDKRTARLTRSLLITGASIRPELHHETRLATLGPKLAGKLHFSVEIWTPGT